MCTVQTYELSFACSINEQIFTVGNCVKGPVYWLPFTAHFGVHRRPSHPVVHQMSLHPDYHQWATGGPPDVATSSGPPDVALAVGTRMLACGCNADADIKWPTGCTHPVVHLMCTHPLDMRM